MAEPELDRSNGWWFIRYRTGHGRRTKKLLRKDPRWSKGGGWPATKKRPPCPPEVLLIARPFQDLDLAARLGKEVVVPRRIDLAGFLRSYRHSYALSHKPNSVRTLDQAIARFLAYCEPRKVATVEQVTRSVCRGFLEGLLREDLAKNTLKSFKGTLGAAFARGVNDEVIAANPWSRLPTPGRDDSDGTPSWKAEEVAAIRRELRGWHADMFAVGVNCGFRQQALCNLEWRDVHRAKPGRKFGRLVCRKEFSKTDKAYSVPLIGELRDVFERRKKESRDPGEHGKVFPGRAPGSAITPTTFRKAIERACGRAKVEYKGHAWHCMRATFATLAHARGVNPRTIQAWMNHSSIQMTDKYSHYTAEFDDREAAKLEGDLLEGQEE